MSDEIKEIVKKLCIRKIPGCKLSQVHFRNDAIWGVIDTPGYELKGHRVYEATFKLRIEGDPPGVYNAEASHEQILEELADAKPIKIVYIQKTSEHVIKISHHPQSNEVHVEARRYAHRISSKTVPYSLTDKNLIDILIITFIECDMHGIDDVDKRVGNRVKSAANI